MNVSLGRRGFLAAAAALPAALLRAADPPFRISLAEWSLHKAIQSRLLTNLDFPRVAREQFGIEGLEFVNGLWAAPTYEYIRRLKANMASTGTKGVLIMCDGEGLMGHSEKVERLRAAANHHKWVEFAAELGCHSIRVNMYPSRTPKTPEEITEFLNYCSESFTALCGFAKGHNLNVIIENHGGVSSDPEVLTRLMKLVNLPNFGLLPDFGNFPDSIDRYEAVRRMMPYAKGVSLKCWQFGPDGNETKLDLNRLMKIVADAGYRNWVGIEYEGEVMSEYEGIAAAKLYLNRKLS